MTAPDVLLGTSGLTKSFGAFRAVDAVSLEVRAGDIYGFLGLNGAGKTTTLRMILGLLRPTSGTITVLGAEVESVGPEERRHLGAMVEGPAFYGRLSGFDNLRLLAGLGGRREPRAAVLDALAKVGLEDAAFRPAQTYSLGMKQRLGIALALLPEPKVVILDEPTNGLDPRGIRDMRDLVVRLNREHGLTFVVSSHLLSEVEQMCTRVAILRRGRLVAERPTRELLEDGDHGILIDASPADAVARAVRSALGPEIAIVQDGNGCRVAADASRIPDLARALVANGAELRAIGPRRPTLEELFLDRAEDEGEGR